MVSFAVFINDGLATEDGSPVHAASDNASRREACAGHRSSGAPATGRGPVRNSRLGTRLIFVERITDALKPAPAWSAKRYMNMRPLYQMEFSQTEDVA
jgi:hypothetical protein